MYFIEIELDAWMLQDRYILVLYMNAKIAQFLQ